MAEVKMPKMGDGMTEGKITSWLKREGDSVREGDSIAEIETDKASVEIPAEESGVLSKIVAKAGETVPVGATIAQIGDSGAAAKSAPSAKPEARRESEANGSAHAYHASPSEMPSSPANADDAPEAERIKASPLARSIAAQFDIDLARIAGTGPGGRIVERDVTAYQESRGAGSGAVRAVGEERKPVAAPKEAKEPKEVAPVAASTGDIPPTRMRAAIARRTAESARNAPHFYVTMIAEMDKAQALLKELNADAPNGGKITITDLLAKACAVALGKVPQVNASYTPEGAVRRYAEAHIGIVVGIEEGLVIPVVRNCESKTLRRISAEAKELIGKARAGQLKPDEFSGGTFSISNLGMLGVDEFTAIINQPEAAILAVGATVREPVVTEDDTIVIRSRMKMTLSSDHRVLDGVVSARFLQEVKRALESPFSLVS